MRLPLHVVCIYLGICLPTVGPTRPLTVEDAVETTRPVMDWDRQSVHVSPRGDRYVVMAVRGDVVRNGVWLEIYSGRLDSLEGARPRRVAHLFTSGLGGNEVGEGDSTELVLAGFNTPRWIDNAHVVLYWLNAKGVKELLSIDVDRGRQRFLTHHDTDVVNYGISPRSAILYGARALTLAHAREVSRPILQRGFAVGTLDAMTLPLGVLNGSTILELKDSYERFLTLSPGAPIRKLSVKGGAINSRQSFQQPIFTTHGDLALVDGSPESVKEEWRKYTNPHFQQMLSDLDTNPGAGYSNQFLLPFIVDIAQAQARPLWSAPLSESRYEIAAWSPDARSILLGPTFLPASSADATGLAGNAVAEVDVATGKFWQLPLPQAKTDYAGARWLTDQSIEIQFEDGEVFAFQKDREGWKSGDRPRRLSEPRPLPRIEVSIDQDVNIPPTLRAADTSTGRNVLLLDFNPGLLERFDLAPVRFVEWGDPDGERVKGRFYPAVSTAPGSKVPLVIQTHGIASPNEFSLYGTSLAYGTLGPPGAIHAAQILAGRGIAVLQIADRYDRPGAGEEGVQEAEFYKESYEAAIAMLARTENIDANRVGLMGHSRTGWHVEYAITHSDFLYAAAIASDNIDGSYLQHLFSGGGDALTGSQPSGEGLRNWLMNSPAFNANRVNTPLQLQVMSGFSGISEPVFLHWEMFRNLKASHKPVELYVAPQITRGAHALQNPGQVIPLLERTVDWWDFWLNNRQDLSEAKTVQYEQWRLLRDQQFKERDKPRPALLSWGATARNSSKTDRLGWLEDLNAPRTAKWIQSQNKRTIEQLSRDARYADYYKTALTIHKDQGVLVGDWRGQDMLFEGRIYNLWQDKTHPRGLWRSSDLGSFTTGLPRWTPLVDFDALSRVEGKPLVYTMDSSFSFPAAQCLAARCMIGVGNGSDKLASYREFDVKSKAFVVGGFVFPAESGSTAVWRDADTLLVVSKSDSAQRSDSVKEWHRGQPLSEAQELLPADSEFPSIRLQALPTQDGRREIMLMQGTEGRRRFWRLDKHGRFTRTALPEGAEVIGRYDDQWIIQLTLSDWKTPARIWRENSVVSIPAADLGSAQPRVGVVMEPAPRQYIHGIKITRDALLITSFDNVRGRAWSLTLKEGSWRRKLLRLPENGAINITLSHPAERIAFLSYESFLKPPTLYAVETKDGDIRRVASAPEAFQGEQYKAEQMEAVSKDGTRIPYFLVRSRKVASRANTPTLLHAYGGAGPEWPEYSPTLGKLWLEAGGAYAFASIRGGGDLGKPWRLWGGEREKTYEDFIAVAEDLISRKITSPRQLGIRGHSNGGLLVGVVLNRRPELFNAAIMENPVLDQLDDRFPFPIGPNDESTRAFVLRTSPLQNLQPSESFPEVLITTNTNDSAVLPYWARKYAATLQEFEIPPLYYELAEGNHKPHGNTPEQAALHDTVVFTYLSKQLMSAH